MVADNEAKIRISAQDEASKAIESLAGNVEGFKKTIVALGLAMAAAIPVAVLVKGLKECVDAAAEEEKGIIMLGQAVKNSGADWDTASAAIEKYLASELARTALDDGEGRTAIQKLTEATGDYKKALSLMSVTQDLAAAKGMGLAEAAQLVGRVAQGNVAMLTRYGITLQKGATATEALAELQKRFGGQAEALGNTYPGQLKKFDVAIGNLKETIGKAMLPVLANFAGKLAVFAMNAMPIAEKAAGLLGKAFGYVGAQVQTLFNVFAIGMKTGGIGGAFEALSASVLRMVGVSEPAIAQVSSTIGKLADGARTLVNVFSGGLKMGGISQGIQDVVAVFTNMLGIGPQVQGMVGSIGGALAPLVALFSNTFSNIGKVLSGPGGLGDKIGNMVGLVDGALTSLRVMILDKVAAIIPTILPVLTTLTIKMASWVLAAVPGLVANLTIFASKIIITIGAILPSLLTAVGKLAIVLVQWVINAIPGLLTNLSRLISTLLSTIGTLLPKLLLIVGNFAKALIGWVLDALPGLLSNIGKFVQSAISALMSYLPGWIASLAKWAIEMVQWIVAALPSLATNLGKFFNEMVNWVVDNLPGWIKELQKLGLSIIGWVVDALPGLGTNLGLVVGALIKWIGQTVIDIAPKLLDLAKSFLEWVDKEVIPKLPGVLAAILTGIVNFLGGIVTAISPEFAKTASGIIGGLIKGLKDAWVSVEGWWKGLVEKLPEWIKNLLGIHSPSTVFAQIGLDIMRGLAAGLEKGEAEVLNTVATVMGNIASALEGMLQFGANIGAVDKLPDVGPFAAWLTETVKVLHTTLDYINHTAMTPDDLVHARDIANVIADLLRGVSVDFAGFTVPKDMPSITKWAMLLEELVVGISGVVQSLITDPNVGAEKLYQAAEAAPAIGTLLGAIGSMVSGVQSVGGFTSVSGLADSIKALVEDARTISKKLVEYFSLWTQTTLDNVTNAGIAATAMGNLLSPARAIIDGVTAIAGYTAAKDIEKSWDALYWDMRAVAIRMTAYFDTWTETTLINVTKAAQGATAMGALLTLLKTIVDGVMGIVDYHKAKDPEGAWDALYWDMRGISIRMVAYFNTWTETTLINVNKASIGATAMGNLFASTKAIIDGVTAIGSYVAAKDIKTSVTSLVRDMMIVRDALVEAFTVITEVMTNVVKENKKLTSGQMPETTQTSSNAAESLLAINILLAPIKGIIDAVSSVSGYVAGINIKGKVRSLVNDIKVIGAALTEAFTVTVEVITDVIKETKKLTPGQMPDLTQVASDATTTLAGINALLAPIKGIIDALEALSTYRPAQNLAMTVKLMTRDVLSAMENLKEGLKDIQGDILNSVKTAGEAAVAVGALFAPIKGIIDALIAIVSYKQSSNLVDATAGLMQDIWDTVFMLRDQFYVIGQKAGETLPIAATASTTIGAIYGSVKGIIEALTAIVAYKQSKNLANAVAAVMTDIWTTIFNLRDLFGSIARDAGSSLGTAATAAETVKAILGATKEIVASLTDLAGMKNIAGLNKAVTDITNAITKLVNALAGNATGAANMGIAATSLTALTTALKNFTELAQWASGILTGLPMFGILFNSKLGTATTMRADVYVHVGGDGKPIVVQNNGQVSGVVNDQLVAKIIQAVNMQLGSQAHNSLALQTRQ